MDRRFIIVLAVVILGLIGLFVFTKDRAAAPSSNTTAGTSNHVKGNTTSGVKLLVYGDFECSACAQFFPIEKEVVNKYINEISFSFKHYPIENAHPNARAAARAAEAAGLQGKFFEMHDALYENYDLWVSQSNPLAMFEKLASSLNLDANKFKTDFASEAVNDTINADLKSAQKIGVDATPTYYLNDKVLENKDISSVESFSAVLDKAIQDAK